MVDPEISVVIATYGRSAMVRQAVESALRQSLQPFEVIVSDDVSPDDTLRVLEAISERDSRVKVLVQPKNTGGVPNWNAVINAARGEFIAWCSDDDYFLPDHLRQSLDYLVRHPDVDMVHSGFLNRIEGADGSGQMSPSALRASAPIVVKGIGIVPYMIRFYCWPFHPSTLVFRRSLWKSVGEFDKKFAIADTEWFARAVVSHRVAFLPLYGVVNRRHFGNWSMRVGSLQMAEEVNASMERTFARLRTIGISKLKFSFWRLTWKSFHAYRLVRLYLARSRAGQFDVVENILRSAAATGDHEGVFVRIFFPIFRTLSSMIRRAQLLFPSQVRKYSEMAKWEPR